MSQQLLRRLYVALDHLTISELMGTLVDRSLPSCAKVVKVCYSDSRNVHVRNFLILIPSSQGIPQRVNARHSTGIPTENCHQSYCGRRRSRSGLTRVGPVSVLLIARRWRLSKALTYGMILSAIWKPIRTIRKPSIFQTSLNILLIEPADLYEIKGNLSVALSLSFFRFFCSR